MTRDYEGMLRGPGVFVPRWMVGLVLMAALVAICLKIMIPPSWIVQRLDSPDGRHAAILMRTRYVRDAFKVKMKRGWFWQTVYYSTPVVGDFRVDLGERLLWTEDSALLLLRQEGTLVWGYHAPERRTLTRQELAAQIAAQSPGPAAPARP